MRRSSIAFSCRSRPSEKRVVAIVVSSCKTWQECLEEDDRLESELSGFSSRKSANNAFIGRSINFLALNEGARRSVCMPQLQRYVGFRGVGFRGVGLRVKSQWTLASDSAVVPEDPSIMFHRYGFAQDYSRLPRDSRCPAPGRR